MKRLSMFLVAALFVAGCSGGSAPPPTPTGTTFDVPAGQGVSEPISGMVLEVPSGTFPTGTTVNVTQTNTSDRPVTSTFEPLPDGEIVISTPKAPQVDPLIDLSNRSRTAGFQYFVLLKDSTWQRIDQFSDALANTGKLAIDKTKFVWDGTTYKVKVLVGKVAIIDINETTGLLERGAEDTLAPAYRVLVMVHGFNDHAESLDACANAVRSILPHRYRHIYSLQYDWRRDGVTVAYDLAGYLDQLGQSGYHVDLLGHSRGGLICRYTMERLGRTSFLSNYFSVCVPNEGSTWANVENLFRFLQEDYFNRPGTDQPWGIAAFDTPALAELVPGSEFLNELNDPTTMGQRGYVNTIYIAENNGLNTDGVVSVPSALAQNEVRGAFTAGRIDQFILSGWHNAIKSTTGAQAIVDKMANYTTSALWMQVGYNIGDDHLQANRINGWDYTLRIGNAYGGNVYLQDLSIDCYNYYGQWVGACWYNAGTPAGQFYPGGYTSWNQSMPPGEIDIDMTTYGNTQQDPLSTVPLSNQAITLFFTLRYIDQDGTNCMDYYILTLGYNGLWPSTAQVRSRNKSIEKQIPVGPRQK